MNRIAYMVLRNLFRAPIWFYHIWKLGRSGDTHTEQQRYDYIRNVDKIKFFIHRHFSVEAYYRIFIPRIFKNFNKILYLDTDIIILDDIANLYNSNTNNKMFWQFFNS